MDKFIDTLKKFGIANVIILLGIILALIVGFFTFKNYRQTADKQIEATSKIWGSGPEEEEYPVGVKMTENND